MLFKKEKEKKKKLFKLKSLFWAKQIATVSFHASSHLAVKGLGWLKKVVLQKNILDYYLFPTLCDQMIFLTSSFKYDILFVYKIQKKTSH